jgi:hypothetical protein
VTELRLYTKIVNTVFDLLGATEDDVTYSLGWALAQSNALATAVTKEFCGAQAGGPTAIRLQESIPGAGRTDIELEVDRVHVVLEAKRGWQLPSDEQLKQYTSRFKTTKALAPVIAVVAEVSPEWAAPPRLPESTAGVPVRYAPWRRIAQLVAETAASSHSLSEKRLLRELYRYLKGVMTVQDVQSNLVYVVPLRTWPPLVAETGLTFVDIVVRHNCYFHPVGGGPSGWPVTPPTYLGFRYDGKLQQIRHADSYTIEDEAWNTIDPRIGPEQGWGPDPHFFYKLGKPIVPDHDVKTGGLFGPGRHWAAIDLLLTCNTVREARDKTQARLDAAGED